MTQINLTWTAATIVGSTISGYQLFRGVNSGSITLFQSLGNVLAYSDGAVSAGNTYAYYVIAVPVVGLNSNPSNEVDIPIPAVSGNLIIRSEGTAQILDIAAGGAPADQILGDFSTIIGLVPDLFFKLSDSGPDFVMVGFCGIAQFDFTSIAMLDFAQTFTSASATFSLGCGTSSWTWPGRALGLAPTTVYTMQVS